VFHLLEFDPHFPQKITGIVLNPTVKSGGAGIMDSNPPFINDRQNVSIAFPVEQLIHGDDLQTFPIFAEYSIAVRTGNQNLFKSVLAGDIQQFPEVSMKLLIPAKIMGWLGAAVQDNTEVWDLSTHQQKKFFQCIRPGPGQSTAGKKDCIAALGEVTVGKTIRSAATLVVQDGIMLFELSKPQFHCNSSHCQEHGLGVQSLWAHCRTEPAQVAFKAKLGSRAPVFTPGIADLTGSAVFLEETTLLDADVAVNTVDQDVLDIKIVGNQGIRGQRTETAAGTSGGLILSSGI